MVSVKGCEFPADRLYDVGNHVWYLPIEEGRVRIGLTQVAVALASRQIFAVTPKRVGRAFAAGRSAATIESSKWVGPMRLVFDGTVAEVNAALTERPGLLAEDAYGAGWVIVATPDGQGDSLAGLTPGAEVARAYRAWMDASDFPGCQ